MYKCCDDLELLSYLLEEARNSLDCHPAANTRDDAHDVGGVGGANGAARVDAAVRVGCMGW